jgi:hypothetical protein
MAAMTRGVAISYIGIFLISLVSAWFPIPVWAQMLPITVMIIYIGLFTPLPSLTTLPLPLPHYLT